MEVGGGGGGGVGVLLELGFERGGAVVCGGLGVCGGRGVCCGLRGFHGLAIELVLEAFDLGSAFCRLIRRGARIVLRCLKLGLELRDLLVDLLLGAGRGRTGLFELSLQLLRTGAVPGGFGAGDVDERLKISGGSGGCVGVLLQLRLEFGGALSGLVGGGVRCVKVALQSVGPVAVLGGFGGGDVERALGGRRRRSRRRRCAAGVGLRVRRRVSAVACWACSVELLR